MSTKYYTNKGIYTPSSGSGINIGGDDSSSDINFDLSTITHIQESLIAMQAKLNNLTNTVASYEVLPTRINALMTAVELLQKNALTVFGVYEPSGKPTNIYSTGYINTTLNNTLPILWDDLGKTIPATTRDVYSATCIRNINNISSIPTVYDDVNKTTPITVFPETYSTKVINDIIKALPKYRYAYYSNNEDATLSVYTCNYINSLQIPSKIYDIANSNPTNMSVYSAKFINTVIDSIPRIVNSKSEVLNAITNAYSCNYINNLAIPNKILDAIDDHVSTSFTENDTLNNIYDTYYIDQYMYNTILDNNDKKYQQNTLMLRLYNVEDHIYAQDGLPYKQFFGDNALTYTLTPHDGNVTIGYFKGDLNTSNSYTDTTMLTLTQDSTLNVRHLRIDQSNVDDTSIATFIHNSSDNIKDISIKYGVNNAKANERCIHSINVKTYTDDTKEGVRYDTNENVTYDNSEVLTNIGYEDLNEHVYRATLNNKQYDFLDEHNYSGTLNIDKDVNINGNLNVGGVVTQFSDMRLKENIHDIVSDYIIDRLKPVAYNYKNDSFKHVNYGFIAQDVMCVAPELVTGEVNPNDGVKYYAVNYIGMVPLIVRKIQSQERMLKMHQTIMFIIILYLAFRVLLGI